MLLSHNPQDQELDFFITFLDNAINGRQEYRNLVIPIIEDAVKLVKKEKSLSDLERTGLNVKFSLYQNAPDFLNNLNLSNISNDDLLKIQEILGSSRQHIIA